MKKVMFICQCNICRSPMAEFIFKDMTRDLPDVEISSKGISGEKAGCDMYDMAKECLSLHGIPFEKREAAVFNIRDYLDYDYIVCMDEWTKYNLKSQCSGDPMNKIFKLLEFSDRNTEGMPPDDAMVYTDIFDPHQDKNFERAYKEICEGCKGLKKQILKERFPEE